MREMANKVRQWLYPAAFRITAGDDQVALIMAQLVALTSASETAPGAFECAAEDDHRDAPAPPSDGEPHARPTRASDELDKDFVIDLCNQLHRIERTAKKLRDQKSSEADRLRGPLERMREILAQREVSTLDLTGEQYEEGRLDFEAMGDPQPTEGLRWPTIIRCERPLVLQRGVVLQPAKGVIGSPVAS